MRRILTTLILAALCGCWTPGSVEEALPKHTEKFPAGTSFFVMKTERRVETALKRALRARGFGVKDKREEADFVMAAKAVTDRKTKFVRARAHVTVKSDFRILEKYVKTL